jgi:hypothetical protein
MITPAKQALLNRLKEFIDSELNQITFEGMQGKLGINTSACFTISTIGAQILCGLGYNARIQRVMVIAGDKIGKELFKEQDKTGRFNKEEVIGKGGWLIGIGVVGPGIPAGQFHYIIHFPEENEILDLTYGQADRPQHNLRAEAYWEKMDSLPESVVFMAFINGSKPLTLNPVLEYTALQERFQQIIDKGITLLKQEGYALG